MLPDLGAFSAEHRATAVGCHDPVSPNQLVKPARLCIRTCLPSQAVAPLTSLAAGQAGQGHCPWVTYLRRDTRRAVRRPVRRATLRPPNISAS